VNATYSLNDDRSVHVLNQAINFLGQFSSIVGTATVKNASEPGAFTLSFNASMCLTYSDSTLFFPSLHEKFKRANTM
jgi:lipocalin